MSEIKILLVDDREDNLLSIETILAESNYSIIKANSGREALKVLLKEQEFNLILMDVKMPGLSGFETASLIYEREKLRNIPIIFITAHSYSDDTIYEGYKTGAVDYIYKPIRPELLKAKVNVFVDLNRKTEALRKQEATLIAINESLASEIIERKYSEEQVRLLNQQLLEINRTLENANSELARFAYVASHDLQEPLRKIQTYGDLLKSKYSLALNEEGNTYVERMQNSAQRLQKLITDILSYSRLTGNIGELTLCNLNDIIIDILVDFELKIKESGAIVTVKELPQILANQGQMTQLFQNIISNALKFSRNNTKPEITINSELIEKSILHSNGSEKFYEISIQDNGIGFDESYAEQIFTLFKRLNDSKDYAGTGIGLAICKKIVEQHRGSIRVQSSKNTGSTFTITLPLTQDQYNVNTPTKQFESAYSR